jgi:hypothetical protein
MAAIESERIDIVIADCHPQGNEPHGIAFARMIVSKFSGHEYRSGHRP